MLAGGLHVVGTISRLSAASFIQRLKHVGSLPFLIVANTVRDIFRLFLTEGMSYKGIADWLNTRNIRTSKNMMWTKSNVARLVRMAWRYAGVGEYNVRSKTRSTIMAPGNWPAIISEDEARAAIAEAKARAPVRRSVAITHRFARMVYCAVCGQRMTIHSNSYMQKNRRSPPTRKRYVRYMCTDHGSVSTLKVMRHVRFAIAEAERMIKESGGVIGPAPTTESTTVAEIAAANEQIDRIRAGVERADTDYYVNGVMDADRHRGVTSAAQKRIEEILRSIERLRDRLHDEEQADKRAVRIGETITLGQKMLDEPNERMANAWLRNHFRIYAARNQVDRVELI